MSSLHKDFLPLSASESIEKTYNMKRIEVIDENFGYCKFIPIYQKQTEVDSGLPPPPLMFRRTRNKLQRWNRDGEQHESPMSSIDDCFSSILNVLKCIIQKR
ncbi:unnamed protein product [Ilex paraguariensis]|uniref:Uncharacterized protein n=1 Tax=Ilex paraguariensis TaxID=185542 RepID=A0ABC8UY36_9AQUA